MDVVLVTGANKGIGYEVARQLAGRSMRVLLGSRDRGRGDEAVRALQAEGLSGVEALPLDITQQESIEDAVVSVRERYGVLDVLINNAGIAVSREEPSTETDAALRKTFDTNFFAAVAVTQAFLPLLRASSNARIVNVSSGLGSLALHSDPKWIYGSVNALAYCASKTALNAFTVLLAKELRASGIKVNVADPGYTATDLNGNSGPQTVAEGSEAIVALATAPPDGATGTYVDRHGTVPW